MPARKGLKFSSQPPQTLGTVNEYDLTRWLGMMDLYAGYQTIREFQDGWKILGDQILPRWIKMMAASRPFGWWMCNLEHLPAIQIPPRTDEHFREYGDVRLYDVEIYGIYSFAEMRKLRSIGEITQKEYNDGKLRLRQTGPSCRYKDLSPPAGLDRWPVGTGPVEV